MTCMKQEFCIHEKYCQRHIGQNFDSCILFSRNSKPMANEEWLHTLTTEQLAEWIASEINERVKLALHDSELNDGDVDADFYMEDSDDWKEWLKQPHNSPK